MSNEPFFTRDGERFVPTQSARGPWDPKSLHGRVIIGLLGAEIERRHGEPDLIRTVRSAGYALDAEGLA